MNFESKTKTKGKRNLVCAATAPAGGQKPKIEYIFIYVYIRIYIYMLLLSGIPGCCFGLLTFVARVKPRGLVAATGSFIAHTHTHTVT
jgi:hypothetical protein